MPAVLRSPVRCGTWCTRSSSSPIPYAGGSWRCSPSAARRRHARRGRAPGVRREPHQRVVPPADPARARRRVVVGRYRRATIAVVPPESGVPRVARPRRGFALRALGAAVRHGGGPGTSAAAPCRPRAPLRRCRATTPQRRACRVASGCRWRPRRRLTGEAICVPSKRRSVLREVLGMLVSNSPHVRRIGHEKSGEPSRATELARSPSGRSSWRSPGRVTAALRPGSHRSAVDILAGQWTILPLRIRPAIDPRP